MIPSLYDFVGDDKDELLLCKCELLGSSWVEHVIVQHLLDTILFVGQVKKITNNMISLWLRRQSTVGTILR